MAHGGEHRGEAPPAAPWFERLGAERIEFLTDARNLRSQQALDRLGAQREGVYRAHVLCHRRDSIGYSLLRSEWPEVDARLRGALERAHGA